MSFGCVGNPKLHEYHTNANEEVNSAARMVCDITSVFCSNADQSDVKFQVSSEAAGTCIAVGTNDTATRTRSATVKTEGQKQVCDRTQLVTDRLLSCSNCNKTFSTHVIHLSKQDGDQTEILNCPRCKHPCTEVDKAFVKSEAAVRTDNCHVCLTVDVSQLRPECTNVSASDQKQYVHQKQPRALNSVDSMMPHKWHQCVVCSRCCSTAAALKQHEQVHAKGSSRSDVASCQTCGKKFQHRSYLRCHERLHNGGGHPFVCEVCGKGFICRSNLTTHRRTHTGDRPYDCSVCHKRFFQLCAVREHEKIHIGIKMFICDICGKQFMTHAQLYNHSRTHGAEKSFECVTCKKRFYTNGDLVKHARIHADRRPFVCDVCGKGFKYSSNLHGHARIHTGSRPFRCETCGKSFTYSSHLSRHAKMHARNTVLEETTTTTTAAKEELQSPSVITQSSVDNIVGVASSVPSAVLLVRPFFI